MRDREVEAESDHRDKQREMEEIDEILRKRLADPSTEKENEVWRWIINLVFGKGLVSSSLLTN